MPPCRWKQHAVLKLLDAAVLLSDLYQILLPAFRIQIAGGHIEVLGRQDLADISWVITPEISAFPGPALSLFKFRLGGVQLALAGYDLGAGLGNSLPAVSCRFPAARSRPGRLSAAPPAEASWPPGWPGGS